MPAAGTNVASSSPAASTTASSWPCGVRSSVATPRSLRARQRAVRPASTSTGRAPCASSPASRTACCCSSPPSWRASGAARGLRLDQAEAVALIADAVCEAARDGASYAAAEAAGYARARRRTTSLDGVPELVRRVEVEALFADGSRLIVLHDPIRAAGPPRARATSASSGSPGRPR